MSTHLLNRRRYRPGTTLKVTEGLELSLGRAHEACGPARISFALWLAAVSPGPVLWISAAWAQEQLNPAGILEFADPSRFLFARANSRDDQLWALEEGLRAGVAPLVVADLDHPPALTPVRRLHLAAEQGGQQGVPPLAVLLTPGEGGAAGIESRWQLHPSHQGQHRIWHLQRLRARSLPPASWHLQQEAPGQPLRPCPPP